MSTRKKIISGIIILVIGLLGFGTWYNFQYSMDVAETYEVNPQIQHKSILIATQGSKFKNDIVEKIVKHYGSQPIYVKVTDVSNLEKVDESVWSAILILHTWEMYKPPLVVETFMNKVKNQTKIVVLTTSGDGEYKMENVDAITGASVMEDVPARVAEIKKRLDEVLML